METQVQKRLTTQTQVRMTVEEVEDILVAYLGLKHNTGCRVCWDISVDCIKYATITATKETEVA